MKLGTGLYQGAVAARERYEREGKRLMVRLAKLAIGVVLRCSRGG
jgi:hypothetical protein